MEGGADTNLDLPVTFENDDLDYGLTDFEAMPEIVVDPTNAGNKVASTVKQNGPKSGPEPLVELQVCQSYPICKRSYYHELKGLVSSCRCSCKTESGRFQ